MLLTRTVLVLSFYQCRPGYLSSLKTIHLYEYPYLQLPNTLGVSSIQPPSKNFLGSRAMQVDLMPAVAQQGIAAG